ncbi:ATP-dependent DNA helicase pif1-like [Aphidius gifuensis]|uniref:ATP-dependent DNA helicase pif1-like n=1 Tax=Aphidius gifuensis TaxID=684658 RepID=UPI001CDBA61B|nr:ATP-dependent DNA helicase pif1-like [Aphidius gifuensis]
MPVPMYADSTSNIKQQSKAAEELRNIDVIICDEAPMAPRYCLELADRTCRDIMNNKLPFGGKIMLMGGDFRQLLPVLKNGTRSEMINLSIKFSKLWENFKIFSLSQNMRTLPEESEFAKYIQDVGNGTLNDNNDNLVIPQECLANRNDDIVEVIFKKLIDKRKYESLSKVAVLSARHIDVDNINDRVVQLLDKDTEKNGLKMVRKI